MFNTPDYQAIRDAILRDIVNQRPDAAIGVDGDYGVRAAATGAAIEGLYQHQQWIARQIFPDTADSDVLDRHCSLRKMTRKAATVAVGTITFNGVPGSDVPAGTSAMTSSEVAFVSTASGTIGGGGSVTLAAQAVVPGAAGNVAAATPLTLTSAPAGVTSAASVVSMSGGTDIESDAELLARLLFRLRNPPCGGAAHDYYAWAMEVPGVSAAYVYANRRGIGTVDVIVLTEGGLPGPGLVADVQAHIDTVRPVQGEFLAFGPSAVTVNVAGTLVLASGYLLTTVSAAIDDALAIYFAALKPGNTAYLNQIRAIVSGTPGVVDFALSSPTGNTVALVDATHTELAVLGTTAWSL